jgi:hypothetical protein
LQNNHPDKALEMPIKMLEENGWIKPRDGYYGWEVIEKKFRKYLNKENVLDEFQIRKFL